MGSAGSNEHISSALYEPRGVTALLEVKDLSVDIPMAIGVLHAVRQISFTVNMGEILCLVGESGCGKSMTALAIMNLLPRRALRSAGRLVFNGKEMMQLSEQEMADIRGRHMAMIFQDPMTSLNPVYTIGNQLMEVMVRHSRVSRSKAREREVFLLEKMGMTNASSRLKQYPDQLSGGLRQRVMIAMALMCEPELIIADEPTTALDVTIQAEILRLLVDLKREFHMAIILITHDLGVVARVADQVAVMYAGQIVETGTSHEIFKSPMHPYTQGLLTCIPVPGKSNRYEHLGAIPGIVPSIIGEITRCSFHNRCQYARQICVAPSPELRQLAEGRTYRCVLEPEVCQDNARKVLI